MPASILITWYAAVAAYAIAAFRLWRNGMMSRYWVMSCWVVFSSISLGMLAAIPWRSPSYRVAYSITCLFLVFLESATILELFLQLCDKFKNFRVPGMVVLGLLGGLGVSASAAIRLSWVPEDWRATWQIVLLLTRHCDAAMAIVLVGAWLLLKWPGVPIRPSASRATLIIAGHSIYGWIISAVTIAKGNRWFYWQTFLPVFGALATGTLISVLMTRGSEACEEPRQVTPEELRAQILASDQMEAELRAGIQSLMRALEE